MNLTKSEVVCFTQIIPITKTNATLQLYIKSQIVTKVESLFLTIINRSVLSSSPPPPHTSPPN